MADPTAQAAQQKLAALAAMFVSKMPPMITEIEAAWLAFQAQPDLSATCDMIELLHRFAGAAGTFGLRELSDACSAAERTLLPYEETGFTLKSYPNELTDHMARFLHLAALLSASTGAGEAGTP